MTSIRLIYLSDTRFICKFSLNVNFWIARLVQAEVTETSAAV